jgi:flagellar assembly factor FliW
MIHTHTPVPLHPVVAGPITAATVDRRHMIGFPGGLPGFEHCRGFILMELEDNDLLHYLTAVEGPEVTFLVIDPRRVMPDYRCDLSEADALRIGADGQAPLLWLSLVTVDRDGTTTVNLRAPIVINPARMLGHQVIPHDNTYPLRHVLLQAE